MEILSAYGLFLLKTATVITGIVITFSLLAALRGDRRERGEIVATVLNDEYDDFKEDFYGSVLTDKEYKNHRKTIDADYERKEREISKDSNRVFVVDFIGDVMASDVNSVRNEITTIISVAKPEDEVVVRLESPGGMVHSYGHAASQLARIKSAGIPLTVCVDEVAASGGYMMACVADKIVAAPFAIIGSVGVVAEFPNFNRALGKLGIDYETYTAGNLKRTVTAMGVNTEENKEAFRKELAETHELFKSFIKVNRPIVNVNEIATGQTWYGVKAIEQKLIDAVGTSDQYLLDKATNHDVIHIQYKTKPKPLSQRIGAGAASMVREFIMASATQMMKVKK